MPQPQPPEFYRKNCTLCNKPRDVLVRCQIDQTHVSKPPVSPSASASASASTSSTSPDDPETEPNNTNTTTTTTPPQPKPGSWHFVCPGSCWRRVSGGVIDGDLTEGRQGYKYGGMWKNKHAGVSAKVPRRLKGKLEREGNGKGGEAEVNGDGEGLEEEEKGGGSG